MIKLRNVTIEEVADLNPRLADTLASDELVSFVPMSAVSAETASIAIQETRTYGEVAKGYTPFASNDVIVAKITPCFENGKIAQAKLNRRAGFGSTEFHVIRPRYDHLDGRYLLHFLRQDNIRKAGERRMTGSAGQRRVPEHFFAKLTIPLPPLPEQKRIADILDRADALRAKRRAALAELDSLTQAIFLEMFGDPLHNPKAWPTRRLQEVLKIPLRNGLSPSKSGKVNANVLTLSAITGNGFDSTAWKTSTFALRPPATQAVNKLDFLICRGNGNINLVGKGYFPFEDMPEMTFPDTMIAARIDSKQVERDFLQHVWNSPAVRKQIESVARTTNGTYKVNQPSLEGISFFSPERSLQREFSRRVIIIEGLKRSHRKSLCELDCLFASLQHRAFRGEL